MKILIDPEPNPVLHPLFLDLDPTPLKQVTLYPSGSESGSG
jgi:hypothetical protein